MAAALGAGVASRCAQAKEQFFPVLSTAPAPTRPTACPGPTATSTTSSWSTRKGGINGVKITFEECETGYATDRGVECYERLKGKNGGASFVQPLSTGITFALTEKAPADKIPLITAGYGRSGGADGSVFKWNFPLVGTYWVAADILVQHIAKKEGGLDKLKGKKIALVYHDSPYGKEPIPLLQERAKMHGFELQLLPVDAPRRRAEGDLAADPPEPARLRVAVGLGRDELDRAQGSGRPPATRARRCTACGGPAPSPTSRTSATAPRATTALALQHGAEPTPRCVKDMLKHGARQGPGHRAEGGGRQGALHARHDERDARRRRRARARRSASARAR